MAKLLASVWAVAFLAAGCGDDDDNGRLVDAATIDTAPPIDVGAAPTTFEVPLTTAEEVPVCASAGATAMGMATITISADDTTITVNLTFSGLSGDATAAHIHAGPAGMAGPPIFTFANLTSPVNATFTAADYPDPPPAEAPADFAAAIAAMKAGMTYVNVHTDACMPGEIRGQID
jgi:hypothetical protein